MNRFFNWLKALFNRTMDRVEDPDIMLDQAKRDMNAAFLANKEKAVQALTQKNRLEQMLLETKRKSVTLEGQATMALKQGNREFAARFMREKMTNDAIVTQLQASYDQAAATVEQVKMAMNRQEEEVRKKTAEALALKAQWKQTQIQSSITKALDGLTFENQFSGFGAATEKIREMQSEAAARQEMYGQSIQGRVMAMEDQAHDIEAESQLQALEQRLGLRSTTDAPEATVQTVSVGGPATPPAHPVDSSAAKSEAEKQLEELEKRLKGS